MASQVAKDELKRILKGHDPSISPEYRRDMFIVIIQYLLNDVKISKHDMANILYECTGYDLRSYLKNPTEANLGKAYDFLETKRAEFPFPNAAYMAVSQLIMAVAMIGEFR